MGDERTTAPLLAEVQADELHVAPTSPLHLRTPPYISPISPLYLQAADAASCTWLVGRKVTGVFPYPNPNPTPNPAPNPAPQPAPKPKPKPYPNPNPSLGHGRLSRAHGRTHLRRAPRAPAAERAAAARARAHRGGRVQI